LVFFFFFFFFRVSLFKVVTSSGCLAFRLDLELS
jgi:hypothetical protein